METAIILGFLKAEKDAILAERDAEINTREIMAGYLSKALGQMYGTITDLAFLTRNGNALNVLRKSATAIIDLVAAAEPNWNKADLGDETNALLKRLVTPGLLRALAMEALIAGKIALLPMVRDGVPRLVRLSGYVRFIMDDDATSGDTPEISAVVQVIPKKVNGSPMFEVRVYSADPGAELRIYPPVKDWADYLAGTPVAVPQPWAAGRLPLAAIVTNMNALGHPSGLVAETLPAFLRYLKSAIDRNAAQEIAGQPESVVYSDFYVNLINNPVDQKLFPNQYRANAEAVDALKRKGPRQVRVLPTNDKYAVNPPVDISGMLEGEASDKRDVLEAFGDLESEGGNLSGVALAERRHRRTTLATALCDQQAQAITDALGLLAKVEGSGVPEGLEVTLTPKFPQDNDARAEKIITASSGDILPRSAAMKGLQSCGWDFITDQMVEAQEKAEIEAAKRQAVADALAADLAGVTGNASPAPQNEQGGAATGGPDTSPATGNAAPVRA